MELEQPLGLLGREARPLVEHPHDDFYRSALGGTAWAVARPGGGSEFGLRLQPDTEDR